MQRLLQQKQINHMKSYSTIKYSQKLEYDLVNSNCSAIKESVFDVYPKMKMYEEVVSVFAKKKSKRD